MKSIKKLFPLTFLILSFCFSIQAQSDRYQMFLVHEDHVKDGMIETHNQADMGILNAAKKHNMNGLDWLTFHTDDGRAMYLSPIENLAALDKNPFGDLKQKMGDEAFEKLFDPFHETYTEHGDYILRLDNELSYMPDGMDSSAENETYRELVFYHIPPGKEDRAQELAKSAKDLYESNKSKVYYRVYQSSFGVMGNYYMVAVSGKDAAAVDKKREENMKLLGKEGENLFREIGNTMSKQEIVTGHVKPELSYSSEN